MKRLPASGKKYIDKNYLEGDFSSVTKLESLAKDTSLSIDLKKLEKEVYWAMQKFDANDSQIDVSIAPNIHQIINISRKQANDYGIWRYLTTVRFNEFVRHRWKGSDGKVGFDRYWGYKRRNTFCRLWWAAELTVKDKNYELTEKLLSGSGQDQFENLVMGSKLSNYPDALIILLQELLEEKRSTYRKVMINFNRLLSVVVLESLDEKEIRVIVKSLVEAIKTGNKPKLSELPVFS